MKTMIKILMTALLMTLLSSCRTKIICREIKKTRIKPLILKDLKIKFNRCRMRCFDLNEYKTLEDKYCGEDFVSGNYEAEKCDGLSGFDISVWPTEIKPNIQKRFSLNKSICK